MRGWRAWPGGELLGADQLEDDVEPGVQPAGKVALLEGGHDGLIDDALDGQVGHRAFKRLADLDAHGAVLARHDDQQAVAFLGAADLPGVGDALRVGGGVFGLRGGHQQHDDLRAGLGFEGGQLGLERGALAGLQRAGLVDHAGVERRHRQHVLRVRGGQAQPAQHGQQQRDQAATGPAARL